MLDEVVDVLLSVKTQQEVCGTTGMGSALRCLLSACFEHTALLLPQLPLHPRLFVPVTTTTLPCSWLSLWLKTYSTLMT